MLFLRLNLVVDFDINRLYFVILVSVAKLKMEKLIGINNGSNWKCLLMFFQTCFLLVIVVKILRFDIIDVMVLVESLNHQETC